MSDFDPFFRSVGQLAAGHAASPEHEKSVDRVVWGSGLLAACCYAYSWWPWFTGSTVLQTFSTHPVPVYILGGLAALSVVEIVHGLVGPRFPRRPTKKIFWGVLLVAIPICGLWFEWYVPVDWAMDMDSSFRVGTVVLNITLRGLYFVFAVIGCAELLMYLLPGRGNPAEKRARDFAKTQHPGFNGYNPRR